MVAQFLGNKIIAILLGTLCSYLHGYKYLGRDKVEASAGEALKQAGIVPVSYTHLDVYKRQGQGGQTPRQSPRPIRSHELIVRTGQREKDSPFRRRPAPRRAGLRRY